MQKQPLLGASRHCHNRLPVCSHSMLGLISTGCFNPAFGSLHWVVSIVCTTDCLGAVVRLATPRQHRALHL